MYDAIECFMKELIEVNILEECNYPTVDMYAIPLLDNLKIVGNQRSAYARMIHYMVDTKYSVWSDIANELDLSAQLWGKIRMYLMKIVLANSNKVDNALLSSYLKRIIELEKNCFKEILNSNVDKKNKFVYTNEL